MRSFAAVMILTAALPYVARAGRAAAARVPAEHWGRNLVANPGFEQDADGDGQPDGWNLPPGQCAWVADEPASGERCLRFTSTDKENYRLVTAPVAILPGVRYRIAAMVRGKDVRDGDVHSQGAGLCIEWMDAKGTWLGGHYPTCKGGTFGWTRLEGETGPVPEEAARGHVVLYLRKHNTGTAWFDDIAVKAIRGPKMTARLLRPAYRATLEAPTKGKELVVEVTVNRREHILPDRVHVSASLTRLVRPRAPDGATGRRKPQFIGAAPRPVPADGKPLRLALALPNMETGSHTLSIRLLGRRQGIGRLRPEPRVIRASHLVPEHDGYREVLCNTSLDFRVAEAASRKVTIDERRRLIVGGKPFFPLGLYLGPTEDEHLERIARDGFNTILCYGYGVAKEPKAYLDRAHRHGLKVVYSVKDFYDGTRWFPKSQGKPGIKLTRHYVSQFRDHPALLAWYTNDELGPKHMPALQAAYDLACELDPNHPTFQVLCRPREFHLYYGVTDILGCDPYPIPRHPVTMVGDWMETAHAGMSRARPVWCVPQIFQWANYSKAEKDREPTFAEKRAMVFLALIHRADGLICYSYYDLFKGVDQAGFERRWKEVSRIAREAKALIPVLLEGREVAVGHADPIRYRILEHDGALHVLAVNTSDAKAALAIPLPHAKTARRADTDAETEVEGGKLIDTLKVLETAVYQLALQ